MSMKSLFCAAMLAMLCLPAVAGNLSYADGRGGWKSTMCVKPARPADLPQDSNIAASDLNERIESYNQYAAQTQSYLDCISKEVERDAQAAQYVLTEASKKEMQAAQDELTEIQAQLQPKKKRKKSF